MKNYKITEEQLKRIIEQVDTEEDNPKKTLDIKSKFFGKKDNLGGKDIKSTYIELDDSDPIQRIFNSLK